LHSFCAIIKTQQQEHNVLTVEDKAFIAAIKQRVVDGFATQVTAEEKQQVLNLLEREGQAVPLSVHVAAAEQGFDTTRIPIASAY